MKKVICVVEDEKNLNDLVKQYLKKEGYEVRSYYTYEEASVHVSDDDVHLWLLDIMLDDKSGFDLIEEIRLQVGEVPVIFMSARDKEFDRIIGLEKGSDDYITKPFSMKELVLRVNNVLKRTYKTENKRVSIDTYELDEEQRKIFDNDEEID
ncbi:MAG: response regulator transcription factor, partial [Erysipelotrichaceae bacterium]